MPQLGEGVDEGTVMRWLKNEGERVEEDEPLLTLRIHTMDFTMRSPAAGILRRTDVTENGTVPRNALLAIIEPDPADRSGRAG